MPNPIAFENDPDIDSALQDIAQEHGSITYQDIMDFSKVATQDDLELIRKKINDADVAGIVEIVKEGCNKKRKLEIWAEQRAMLQAEEFRTQQRHEEYLQHLRGADSVTREDRQKLIELEQRKTEALESIVVQLEKIRILLEKKFASRIE